MQASAQQVQWIPIEEITQEEDGAAPEGEVQVRRCEDGTYTLVSGADRLRRMKQAGQLCVDAVLSPCVRTEERISRLLDDQVRGRVHYLEEAEIFAQLIAGGMRVEQLAQRIGRTPQTVRRRLRLMELTPQMCALLVESGLCEACAQQLMRLPGQQGRLRVLTVAAQRRMGMKEMEKLVDDVLSRMPVPVAGDRRLRPVIRDYRLYLNAIRGVVEQMTDAGLDARMQVNVGRHVAEVRITVPVFAPKAQHGGCVDKTGLF